MTAPKVSVVMTVYNTADYLPQSVNSILSQTYSDFEFIIVDDGSTDETPSILAAFEDSDARIKVYTNASNLSVPASTNRGFALARGEYIARMDGDDIASPLRFEKQVALLDETPNLVVVGAGYQEIDSAGRVRKTDCEHSSNALIQWRAVFRMPLLHSSLMFRRDAIITNELTFDPDFDGAADFEFTQRLLQAGNATVIAEPLMQYRMHPQNVSTRKRDKQCNAAVRACLKETTRQFPELDIEQMRRLFQFLHVDTPVSAEETSSACTAMQCIHSAFAAKCNLSGDEIRQQESLATRWIMMAILRSQRKDNLAAALMRLLSAKRHRLGVLSESIRYLISRTPRLKVPTRFSGALQK